MCLDAPMHLDTILMSPTPNMFKHPLVCSQCFTVHLPYVPSTPPHPPKIETVQNQFFQDHHTLPKQKLFKISSFMTTTPSQNRNCSKSVLSRPPHPPKVETRNCSKSVLSRPPHPPKVETVQNQFFQDHHTLPK